MTATIVGPGGVVDQGEAGTDPWPVSVSGGVTVTGGASESTLALVLAAVDGLEVSVTGVDLNTDGIETQLTSIFNELLQKLEAGDVTGLATSANQAAAVARLESILAKIVAAPATEAKQDTANTSLASLDGKVPDESGIWDYSAGDDGTVTLTGGKRVIGIAAHATTAGSLTIDGGDSVPVPANSSIEITPKGNLTDPVIVLTGTDSYFIEHLT